MEDSKQLQLNTGVIFINREKKSEKHPDITIKINHEGKELSYVGWQREDSRGEKYYKIEVNKHPISYTLNLAKTQTEVSHTA
jgi:uncharacterized protein (DUF736 family)